MNRAQAQCALLEGKKITHKFFTDNEYVKHRPEDNKLVDESGQVLNKMHFWMSRDDGKWDTGWSIFQK